MIGYHYFLSQLTLLYLDAHFFYSYKLFLDGIHSTVYSVVTMHVLLDLHPFVTHTGIKMNTINVVLLL